MIVSVIVRDVEGGTASACAGTEGPAPALSAGSGARKTRCCWPSSIEERVFFSTSSSCFSSSSLEYAQTLSATAT